mgnify:CR=1 FL=1
MTVVRITAPDNAGSIFNLFNSQGTHTPDSDATSILPKMAMQIVIDSIGLLNQP